MAAVASRLVAAVRRPSGARVFRLSAAGGFRPVPAGRTRARAAEPDARDAVVSRPRPFASSSEEETWLTRSVGRGVLSTRGRR